jgi:TolB-like protein/tetratricopeptide (TPR) repeat protein
MSSEKMVDPSEMRLQLSRLLQSRVFERAQRSQRFLCYLVDARLADPPVAVKEYTVAIDVFDRDSAYDPSVDATVRVEASRLRSRLREYYAEEGRDDPWIIEIPKGGYNVVFTKRPSGSSASETVQDPVLPESAQEPRLEPMVTPPMSHALRAGIVPKSGHWLWIALLILLGGTGVLTAWHYRKPHPQVATATTPVSLAIVPIANRTGDPSRDYIADGLSDDLIRQLSQVPGLRLMGRTTMFHYQGRAVDAGMIGKTLHVDAVMTGELRRTPDHTALAIEITSAGDGSVVLNREYIADAGDLPGAQADLQRDVLEKLHVENFALDPSRMMRSVTTNPEAYQEFLQGSTLARTLQPAEMHQAINHFERAVALDPQFDLAWASLASSHVFLGLYFEPPREQMPQAREYAQRALAINPGLGEAHGDLGLIHLMYDWNVPAAQVEMSKAGAKEAAIATLTCTAHLMVSSGKTRTAEEMVDRMITYDPESAVLIGELGCVAFYRGNYDAALRHYRDALQSDPQNPVTYWGIAKTLNAQGKHAEALKVLRGFSQRRGFEPPILTAERGYALGASGQYAEALQAIRTLSTDQGAGFHDPYLVSIVYLSMNDRASAFQWLDKALDVRSAFAISILTEPKWRLVQNDPRFTQAVQRLLTSKA